MKGNMLKWGDKTKRISLLVKTENRWMRRGGGRRFVFHM